MTITAEFTQLWSGADVDPWVDEDNFYMLNGTVKILDGGLRPSSSGNARSVTFTGAVDRSADMKVSIHLAQDGITANDFAGPAFVNPVDNSGYWMRLGNTEVKVYKQAPGATSQGSSISASAFSPPNMLASDTWAFTMSPAGVFTCWRNGLAQSTFADTQYITELVPAVMLHHQNTNKNGIAEFGVDGLLDQTLTITDVNVDNTIVSNGPIIIGCTEGDTVTGATLSNGGNDPIALSITGTSAQSVSCAPVDMHTTAFAPGQVLTISITDGDTSPGIPCNMVQIAENAWLVATAIDATDGLLKDLPAAEIGDGYEGPTAANSGLSTLSYLADGPHRNYDPAVPNMTITEGWFYDTSLNSWEIITETTNRAEGAVSPFWRATPSPPACVVGLAYSYCFGSLVEGDRPIDYVLETGAYPAGLVINDVTECIEGTPTESGQFTGLSISATNDADTATSGLFVLDSSPLTLTDVIATEIQQNTATLSVKTNSGSGTLYAAVRTDGPYTQADAELIKNGPGAWTGELTPITGSNSFSASGLSAARTQYTGFFQESGTEISLVATGSFLTLANVEGPAAPGQCSQYPDLISYSGIPVHHHLIYGWAGDAPLTIAVDALPTGLEMDSAGYVTGTPIVPNSTGVNVTVTNANGEGIGSFSWNIYTLQTPAPEGMSRKELIDAVVAYSDRYSDTEMLANMDAMIEFAEHRMSRIMRNRQMCGRVKIPLLQGEEWQQLPTDFDGMRECAITPADGVKQSLEAITPQQATQREAYGSGNYYVIQANRLRLVGEHEGDIEITYYQRVPPLIDDNDTNWVLQTNADIYQIAIQSQISLFAKDMELAAALDTQLVTYFSEMAERDQKDRWSGGPLSTRVDF